ncbi:aspartate carbamoyltransferase catalytic subunit [Thermoanaerobacter brockii subsp. lactiethylicus]|uniref:Aspartate carbamoyltransferase n=2 Tax=Thermoanaerobacter TaxID=1754 RepID=B0KA36_THEP3|nr:MULTISPECIES: aspartate carbamoyltransferase catalytic subunit [Thermoanaerobacter]KUJ90873.1 MAG: aspartate carbamoyltransferase [Thermoanaerobacter thermocopriae]ABY93100.1 aspartate carbamoyltransferase [Thermoanaerobacter sp. X514]ABY94999.1 aspartate carbamoyltransferase [Thermoanaerobacter pseudethanolicus ATCC 33223]ADV79947.1 aspartate carbamoyltransferase [Thermoanaerobacter brockii subsp. finnii Ako-1]MBZ4656700.1 aspartate carbamoyltransferase [Thermoanaerobacter sp.]
MKRKDLLGIKDLSKEEILEVLDTAKEMKKILNGEKYSQILKGKTVVTIFFEPSTRTRLSFEMAAKYLGAHYGNIEVATSSVAKGESLIDTIRTVEMMKADVIITRHNMSGAPHLMAKYTNASIINAGDGINEHPTQALLDMMTIREKKESFEGLKVAIIGDIMHSRVARSNIWGLKKMGAEVRVAGPSTLMPPAIEKLGVKAYYNVEEAIEGADVVMGLRIQLERQKSGLFPSIDEYREYFGINKERMKLAKPDAILMHPGPINRNVELTSEAANDKYSVIEEQVTNGVAVRMALLKILCERRN